MLNMLGNVQARHSLGAISSSKFRCSLSQFHCPSVFFPKYITPWPPRPNSLTTTYPPSCRVLYGTRTSLSCKSQGQFDTEQIPRDDANNTDSISKGYRVITDPKDAIQDAKGSTLTAKLGWLDMTHTHTHIHAQSHHAQKTNVMLFQFTSLCSMVAVGFASGFPPAAARLSFRMP